jgi:hypothetical protein
MNAEAQEVIYNLINGNLTDAKEGAKNLDSKTIMRNAEDMGYPLKKALLMASYLKGVISFQEYCDNHK